MRSSFVGLVAFILISVPALAQGSDQTTATPPATPQAQAQAKPKMVKKRVCTQLEAVTGSRTNGRSKECKTIEVPAPATEEADKGHQDHNSTGASN